MPSTTLATMVLLAALHQGAQPPTPAPPAPAAGAAAAPQRTERPEEPQFDPDAVQRGKDAIVARCGFCHGSNARGGSGGSDLTRSPIVQEDENGKQLGEFLKVGRPDRGMPKFDLAAAEVSDLATFLHSTIYAVSNRGDYQILDVVTGDPKAGETYFKSKGCASCHSVEGDLKGVGGKYDGPTLQGRLLMPRGGGGWGPPRGRTPPYMEANAMKAKVTLASGESATGALVRLTDFDVTLYDSDTKQMRSWLRRNDIPKVVLMDPLQAHVDYLRKWTDQDMHDVTAFLAGLK
ncbi:MAG TPA: c-type cytochrome [Vicinamibacteria bacterium]|nr:c-type cytochrome [Vicinamibacteria bacterium]